MGQDFLGTITGPTQRQKSSLQLILRLINMLMLVLMLLPMLKLVLMLVLMLMLIMMVISMLKLVLILMPGDSLVPPSSKLTLNLCVVPLARMRRGRCQGDCLLPYVKDG